MDSGSSKSDALRLAFTNPDSSERLNLAMNVGTFPADDYIDVLVDQFAREPDFYVRDMLTWALLSHNRQKVIERILSEINSDYPQMRSQCLHTLSKIADPTTWHAITKAHLTDSNDSVATTAWRAAAILVPEDDIPGLLQVLCSQLGRGDDRTRLSLSKAILSFEDVGVQALKRFSADESELVRSHVESALRLLKDHEAEYQSSIDLARLNASLNDTH